eukprot:sb/3478715/
MSANQNSLFRSRDWLLANQGPVFPNQSSTHQTLHSQRAGYMWSRGLKRVVISGCSDTDNCDISEDNILPMYDHVCSIDEVLTVHCSGKRFVFLGSSPC